MSELLKVEIKVIDGEWRWMGKLSNDSIRILCDLADILSDRDVLATDSNTESTGIGKEDPAEATTGKEES